MTMEPQEGCWITELQSYLTQGILPEKEEEAERVARQATAYCIRDGELYRRRPNYVSLRCISRGKGRNCWRIYTVGTVGIIHRRGPSLARRSVADSIGPLRSMMPSNW